MKNFLVLILGLIGQMVLFAQTPPDPGDNALGGSGDQELPVDQYTILLVVILLGVAVWYYKKNVMKLVK
ncbi:hypothetical protein UJ101_01893 [Flavobacteriaceae bacterium UJ101]|nr:hypothetical protein UJ101_01893 [Flavobacteriaceae bacterium UJ101]